ncbi:MAG: hypothetical protein K6G32_04625 [Prevotella sp.]|nr:hypothetical protein [Prevotella sp.]
MKKIFTLILTAMLSMSIQAQDFADYASVIGKSYNQLSRQYSDLEELFEGFYSCNPGDGKTESLMIAFNDDLEAYMAMQSLSEGAYTLEQIIAYMKSNYTQYESESYVDEESGETVTTYNLGNTPVIDDATLVISFSDNTLVSYSNPKATPEIPDNAGLGEMSPIEVVGSFIGKSLDDIEEEYPGVFSDMFGLGIYSAYASDDNEWLEGAVLLLDETTEVATGIRLLFAIEDEQVIAYYTENGYTSTENGTDEDGQKVYVITNGTYTINYAGGTGEVTKTGDTGISSVKINNNNAVWYSAAGSRLNGKPTRKGLYIQGNRKVIIK